jgi:hypothetical protein
MKLGSRQFIWELNDRIALIYMYAPTEQLPSLSVCSSIKHDHNTMDVFRTLLHRPETAKLQLTPHR